MIYDTDNIIEASITKTKLGQKFGLRLEEKTNCAKSSSRNDEDNNNCSRSLIYVVTEVGGLFKKNNLPVQIGDELLEVNGIPVTNTVLFPNGLKDIQKFMKKGRSIRVKVGRNCSNNDGYQTSATDTEKESLDLDDSGDCRYEIEKAHATVIVNHEPRDAPVLAKRRGRRKKKKETLGTLIRDTRSYTPPPGGRRGARRGKKPTRVTVSMAGSSHSRAMNKRSAVYGLTDGWESSGELCA